MNNLTTLLYDLKHKPMCLLPQYAEALKDKIEKYLAGDMPMSVTDPTETPDVEPEITNGVATIEINGIICKRVGLPTEILEFFGLCDLDNVDAELKAALTDANVKSVVIYVTSPGGYLSGVQSTAALVDQLSQVKETVVYSDLLNASAAFLISSQANTIIVSRDAEVGSVGVYTSFMTYNRMLTDAGVDAYVIKAGKWKALGDPTQPLSDEQKSFVQDEINQTWEMFKATVNNKRSIAEEDLQGQTFSGKQLLDKGFVDGFADGIEQVIETLTTTTTTTEQ